MIFCLLLQGCNKEEAKSSIASGFTSKKLPRKEEKARPAAPDFILPDLSGNEVSLKQFKGQIVLLDFWATWCLPCRRSIPELIDIQEKYEDQDLVILGVSVDDPRKANDNVLLAFKKRYKINYSILRVTRSVGIDYFGNTQMAIPTLFVIDREGGVASKIVGYQPGVVERELNKLL
jgi:peroxiredoxin